MKNFVEELKWRGMLHDIMPGTEELLLKGPIRGYIGFDPTSDSLHIGNMVQIMTLVHFQDSGHIPVALVGGATGMVGDPSGKSTERNLLTKEILDFNQKGVTTQLKKFLDFEGPRAATVLNNYDWIAPFSFLDFIRDVGKHININYMLAKDSVQKRLETGLSFTEFTYQLVQGYDFYWMWKNKEVKLQMGGSDQWGNIVTGTELIRRISQGEAYALTTPLITKADGTKFGKSEQGNIWLDPKKTSPYQFYQYWINASDEDASKYIRIFSRKGKSEIEDIIAKHEVAPHERILQRSLATELMIMVHSQEDLEQSLNATQLLFGNSPGEALEQLTESMLLDVMEGVPAVDISRSEFQNCSSAAELLGPVTKQMIFSSKGEARRMIQSGGVSINKLKISDSEIMPKIELLKNKYLLAQKGRKNYYLIRVID